MDALIELRNLVGLLGSSNVEKKREAERKLMEIQNHEDSCNIFLDLLMIADDHILFYIGIIVNYYSYILNCFNVLL